MHIIWKREQSASNQELYPATIQYVSLISTRYPSELKFVENLFMSIDCHERYMRFQYHNCCALCTRHNRWKVASHLSEPAGLVTELERPLDEPLARRASRDARPAQMAAIKRVPGQSCHIIS